MSLRKYRGGHYPGHLRDMFLEAIDAFRDWNEGEPEPTVEYQKNYQASQIPISRACGLLWNCTDIIASGDLYTLELIGTSFFTVTM
jgi:hypothetical protein